MWRSPECDAEQREAAGMVRVLRRGNVGRANAHLQVHRLLRPRAAHHGGEMTWRSRQRTRFAFGTMATPRTRRGFTPRPFPLHPLARPTAGGGTFRLGGKGMC